MHQQRYCEQHSRLLYYNTPIQGAVQFSGWNIIDSIVDDIELALRLESSRRYREKRNSTQAETTLNLDMGPQNQNQVQ